MLKDYTLLRSFREGVQHLHPAVREDILETVHRKLLSKIYNARCNEFLRTISKLSCIQKNKAVDVNIGLRDQLKCYAANKETEVKEQK